MLKLLLVLAILTMAAQAATAQIMKLECRREGAQRYCVQKPWPREREPWTGKLKKRQPR